MCLDALGKTLMEWRRFYGVLYLGKAPHVDTFKSL
jgi:hypothetical protein